MIITPQVQVDFNLQAAMSVCLSGEWSQRLDLCIDPDCTDIVQYSVRWERVIRLGKRSWPHRARNSTVCDSVAFSRQPCLLTFSMDSCSIRTSVVTPYYDIRPHTWTVWNMNVSAYARVKTYREQKQVSALIGSSFLIRATVRDTTGIWILSGFFSDWKGIIYSTWLDHKYKKWNFRTAPKKLFPLEYSLTIRIIGKALQKALK